MKWGRFSSWPHDVQNAAVLTLRLTGCRTLLHIVWKWKCATYWLVMFGSREKKVFDIHWIGNFSSKRRYYVHGFQGGLWMLLENAYNSWPLFLQRFAIMTFSCGHIKGALYNVTKRLKKHFASLELKQLFFAVIIWTPARLHHFHFALIFSQFIVCSL